MSILIGARMTFKTNNFVCKINSNNGVSLEITSPFSSMSDNEQATTIQRGSPGNNNDYHSESTSPSLAPIPPIRDDSSDQADDKLQHTTGADMADEYKVRFQHVDNQDNRKNNLNNHPRCDYITFYVSYSWVYFSIYILFVYECQDQFESFETLKS